MSNVMTIAPVCRYRFIHEIEVHGKPDMYYGYTSDDVTTSTHILNDLDFSDVVYLLSKIENVEQDMLELNDSVAEWMKSEYQADNGRIGDTYNERYAEFKRLESAFNYWASGDGDELVLGVCQTRTECKDKIVERIRIERVVNEA